MSAVIINAPANCWWAHHHLLLLLEQNYLTNITKLIFMGPAAELAALNHLSPTKDKLAQRYLRVAATRAREAASGQAPQGLASRSIAPQDMVHAAASSIASRGIALRGIAPLELLVCGQAAAYFGVKGDSARNPAFKLTGYMEILSLLYQARLNSTAESVLLDEVSTTALAGNHPTAIAGERHPALGEVGTTACAKERTSALSEDCISLCAKESGPGIARSDESELAVLRELTKGVIVW